MREVSLKQEFIVKDVKESLKGNMDQFDFVRQAYLSQVKGKALGMLENFQNQVKHEIQLRDNTIAYKEQDVAQYTTEIRK